jgi:hypothetical protein
MLPGLALHHSPPKSACFNIIVDILVDTWILRLTGPGGQPRVEIMIMSGFKAAQEKRTPNAFVACWSQAGGTSNFSISSG